MIVIRVISSLKVLKLDSFVIMDNISVNSSVAVFKISLLVVINIVVNSSDVVFKIGSLVVMNVCVISKFSFVIKASSIGLTGFKIGLTGSSIWINIEVVNSSC